MSNNVTGAVGHATNSGAITTPEPAESRPQAAPQSKVSIPRQDSVEPRRIQFDEAVAELDKYVNNLGIRVQFEIDDRYGALVIKVMDSGSQEVIRQIPPEQVLELVKFFRDLGTSKRDALERSLQGLVTRHDMLEGLLIQVKV